MQQQSSSGDDGSGSCAKQREASFLQKQQYIKRKSGYRDINKLLSVVDEMVNVISDESESAQKGDNIIRCEYPTSCDDPNNDRIL